MGDIKEQEAKRLADEQKQRELVKNTEIHFNFCDTPQCDISNFFLRISEIASKQSKFKKKGLIVGCGAGRLCFEMAKEFEKMDGIDTNMDLIESAESFKTQQKIKWM